MLFLSPLVVVVVNLSSSCCNNDIYIHIHNIIRIIITLKQLQLHNYTSLQQLQHILSFSDPIDVVFVFFSRSSSESK